MKRSSMNTNSTIQPCLASVHNLFLNNKFCTSTCSRYARERKKNTVRCWY